MLGPQRSLKVRSPNSKSFALGIERDKAAIFAGLPLPHSNGIAERMGFGRAGFPLLCQRVLHACLVSAGR